MQDPFFMQGISNAFYLAKAFGGMRFRIFLFQRTKKGLKDLDMYLFILNDTFQNGLDKRIMDRLDLLFVFGNGVFFALQGIL